MARGGNTKRNIAPEQISRLIRGDAAALQAQAAVGGNAQLQAERRAKGLDENSGEVLPPGIIAFDSRLGIFLPGPGATKEQVDYAQKLIDDAKNGLAKVQPNNTQPLTSAEARAEIAASDAAEQAFKEYLESKQVKTEFESEEAAAAARQEAFERYVKGQQSANAAAASAATPAASQKAKKNPKASEPKGEKKEEAEQERPWWMSGGSGPRFLFGRGGFVIGEGGGGVTDQAALNTAGAEALLAKRAARKAKKAGGGSPPPSAPAR